MFLLFGGCFFARPAAFDLAIVDNQLLNFWLVLVLDFGFWILERHAVPTVSYVPTGQICVLPNQLLSLVSFCCVGKVKRDTCVHRES